MPDTTFPTSFDDFPDEATLRARDLDDATLDHPAYDHFVNSAVRALEEKVGIDGSGDNTSLDYKGALIDAHLIDTIGAHQASAITMDPTGLSNTDAVDLQEMAADFDAAISTSGITPSTIDAAGDLIVGTGDNTYTRLAMGAANLALSVNAAGTALEYRDVNALPQVIDTAQVESFTIALDQVGQWVPLTADDADPRTITLPQDSDVAVPIGTTITFEQTDALAEWTFSAGSGANILPEEGITGDPRAAGQGAIVFAYKKAANTWRVTGQLVIDDFFSQISETGVWSDSGADTGTLDGGTLTGSVFVAEQTYTALEDPLPAASGGLLGVYFQAQGQVDLDYVGDALVGPKQSSGFFGPRGVFNNELTQVVHEDQDLYGHGPVSFMSSMMVKNVVDETREITPGYSVIMSPIFAADGGALTFHKTDADHGATAFIDNTVFITAGTGTIDADEDSDYSIISFASNPVVHGNVTLQRRIGLYVRDPAGGAGTGSVWDAVPSIGGRLTNTVDDTSATINEQYGVLIDRLADATTNVGISCDSQVKLWSDTVTFTAEPVDVISVPGALTMGSGSSIPPRILSTQGLSLIVDTSLFGFAVPSVIYNNMTYKSAANTTNRDMKQMRSFFDSPTIQADQSDDTMANFSSFHSAPVFSTTGAGSPTLALTDLQQFYADAASSGVGANVTVTTWRGFRVANQSGSGTITNQIGLDIASLTKGATLNIGIRNASRTVFTPSTQALAAVGDTITPTATVHAVTVAAGGLTMTSAPTIADGADGQILTLINVDSADTVTIQDQGTLASSNLRLVGTNAALAPRESITLMYSSTVGDWVELHRSGNVT